MTDEILLTRGYKEYPKTPIESEGVEKCFQKRFTDDKGIKYFINVKKWGAWIAPSGNEYHTTYEYDVQMYKKDSHDALDLVFHSSWGIEDVEAHVEALFATGMHDYYEEW